MYGSVYVRQVMKAELPTIPEVVAAVGNRLHGGQIAPQGWAYPFAIYYAQPGTSHYGGAVGHGAETSETLGFVMRLIDQNTTISRIFPAVDAAYRHFDGKSFAVAQDGATYTFTFNATGEWPLAEYSDGGTVFQDMGHVYELTVYKE